MSQVRIEKQCFVPASTPIFEPIGRFGLEYTVKRRKMVRKSPIDIRFYMERNNNRDILQRDILQRDGPIVDSLFRPAKSFAITILGVTSSPLAEDLEVSVFNHNNTR